MKTTTVNPLNIIGISVRTSNANGQAAQDIPALWNKFMTENTQANIPNKVCENIYAIYTDYEGDHTLPYTTIIGCEVSNFEQVPEGMTQHIIKGGKYQHHLAKGNMDDGIIINKWKEIWAAEAETPRAYTSDFEIYGPKAADMSNAEVDIMIALND